MEKCTLWPEFLINLEAYSVPRISAEQSNEVMIGKL
jgi:hypothetical protein